MNNEQAPECCPFCGAPPEFRDAFSPRYPRYRCRTMIHIKEPTSRSLQSPYCITAERERLTRERDEANETIRLQHELIKTAERRALQKGQEEREQLRARVKQLESEWSGWPDLQREWFGDKYAAMQPLEAVRARIEDTEARVKRLEEAGDAILWYFRPKDTGDISFLQSEAMKQWAAAKDTQ